MQHTPSEQRRSCCRRTKLHAAAGTALLACLLPASHIGGSSGSSRLRQRSVAGFASARLSGEKTTPERRRCCVLHPLLITIMLTHAEVPPQTDAASCLCVIGICFAACAPPAAAHCARTRTRARERSSSAAAACCPPPGLVVGPRVTPQLPLQHPGTACGMGLLAAARGQRGAERAKNAL